MISTIRGFLSNRGGSRWAERGTAVLERHALVVTSTVDQIFEDERPAPREPSWIEYINFTGTAEIYIPNPVGVMVLPGPFVLGGSGHARFHVPSVGTFSDFAVAVGVGSDWHDPLGQGYLRHETGGTATSTDWSRSSITVVPPRRAAFAVPEMVLASVPAGVSTLLDAFQYEAGSEATAYVAPRSVTPYVRPSRINFATDTAPSSTDTTGTKTFVLSGLVPGATYTASAEVAKVRVLSSTGRDLRSYRDGSRSVLVFRAEGETEHFQITGGASPWSYRRVLVEQGSTHLPWFDGDSGVEFLWESGKTPGEDARSFHYRKRDTRHWLLRQSLEKHATLGVHINAPVYGTFPSGPPASAQDFVVLDGDVAQFVPDFFTLDGADVGVIDLPMFPLSEDPEDPSVAVISPE